MLLFSKYIALHRLLLGSSKGSRFVACQWRSCTKPAAGCCSCPMLTRRRRKGVSCWRMHMTSSQPSLLKHSVQNTLYQCNVLCAYASLLLLLLAGTRLTLCVLAL